MLDLTADADGPAVALIPGKLYLVLDAIGVGCRSTAGGPGEIELAAIADAGRTTQLLRGQIVELVTAEGVEICLAGTTRSVHAF